MTHKRAPMMRGMDLDGIAAELYALPPGEFTAARNERAKRSRAAGEALLAKQVARLPKPSAAAWTVNMLVRRQPAEIGRVVDLGAALREAQEALDPKRMRELGQRRTALLAAAVQAAQDTAGGLGAKVSDAAEAEVEQTLRAAMADPRAARAVQSGLLVRSLSSNGIEPVDLAGAVAVPGALPDLSSAGVGELVDVLPARKGTGTAVEAHDRKEAQARERAETRARELAEAEAELAEAQRGLADAEAELAEAQQQAAEASAVRTDLTATLAGLRSRIEELEEDLAGAERELALAERSRRLASRLAEQERRAVQRARERLDRLS